VSVLDLGKALAFLLLAALVQVSLATPLEVASGHPEVVVVALVALALVRGPLLGAVGGFWAGFVLDVAAMGAVGLSSLVLTLTGYWAGRFGQATTRSSPHPPLVAVALASVWVVVGSGLLHFMLGQGAPVLVLLGEVLVPTLALNLLLAYPVYRLVARLFPLEPRDRREVALV
jgi:rod shape-determining protein MreD